MQNKLCIYPVWYLPMCGR